MGEVGVGLWGGWGRMRLVCGGVGTEVEVEGMATAAWVDRLRSPAGERGLVFWAGLPGRWLGGERWQSLGLQEAVAKRPCPWRTQPGAQP